MTAQELIDLVLGKSGRGSGKCEPENVENMEEAWTSAGPVSMPEQVANAEGTLKDTGAGAIDAADLEGFRQFSPKEPPMIGEGMPDEFAAQVEQVRSAWPDGPPMIAQDMPDWPTFCSGWWRDCFECPHYDGNQNGSPCALWEAAFPSVVRWYPPNY